MKTSRLALGLAGVAIACAAGAAGAQAPAGLGAFDGLVARWMDLRTTLARENQQWEEQREQWLQELDLMQREADALQAEIDQGSGQASSVERDRAEVLARKEAMTEELDELRAVLDRAEADLRRWAPLIPDSLRPGVAAAFRALPATERQAAQRPLVQRAQAVVALYSQIEALQHGFHATREMLETGEGDRRQVEVLYVGLARAFAVSPDNAWAAVGEPAGDGWTWTPRAEDAPAVRTLLEVFNRRETARLVDLPMALAGEARP